MDIVLLIVGLLVPWVLGILLQASIGDPGDRAGRPGELAWTAGVGWFVGSFLLTVWMRALSVAGIGFGILSVGGPLLLATVLVAAWARHRLAARWLPPLKAGGGLLGGSDLRGWHRAAWLGLLAWLALRYALLLGEVAWRPIYPWDAWTQWATKARVWFELRAMVPFAPLAEWLAAPGTAYIDSAPHYPATVPLLQTWGAVLLGQWDDAHVNLPWWLTAVAFAWAVYGFLVHRGFDRLSALAGTWLVVSLPILNVHAALAGYADLAMATFFTLGALATLRWLDTRRRTDAALALLLLAACATIKNPGKVWVLVMLPGLVVGLAPRHGVKLVAAGLAATIAALAVLAQTEPTILGYRLHLVYNLSARALFDAYFTYGNWHLLWYAAIAAGALGWRQALSRDLVPLTVVVATGLLFLFFGFAFTNAGAWVEDQSTVNRATLHLAPLVAIWMLLVFRAWATANAGPAPAIGASTPPAPG